MNMNVPGYIQKDGMQFLISGYTQVSRDLGVTYIYISEWLLSMLLNLMSPIRVQNPVPNHIGIIDADK